MAADTTCQGCGGAMRVLRREQIADTAYTFMRCESCKREIARREED